MGFWYGTKINHKFLIAGDVLKMLIFVSSKIFVMISDRVLVSIFQIFLLSIIFSSPGFAQIPDQPYPNSHFETVDSVRFHYRIFEDSLPKTKGKVVLIHGFIGSTYCWRENYSALAEAGYTVVAIDLPGFGYSDRSLQINQSQSNRARLLWDLLSSIDKQDSTKWNLVGHSVGGGTAEAMALMHPEKTRSLTVVDGMLFIHNNTIEAQFTILARNKQYNKIMVAYMEKNLITFNAVRKAIKKNFRYEPDSTVVVNYLTPLMLEGTAESVMNVWAKAKEIASLDAKDLISLPVLVIWGDKDKTINLRTGKRFKKHVPNTELIVIPGAGHDPMETHPVQFNRILLEFLDKNAK